MIFVDIFYSIKLTYYKAITALFFKWLKVFKIYLSVLQLFYLTAIIKVYVTNNLDKLLLKVIKKSVTLAMITNSFIL